MKRFVLRFLVGALAVLVLYEGLQRLQPGDPPGSKRKPWSTESRSPQHQSPWQRHPRHCM